MLSRQIGYETIQVSDDTTTTESFYLLYDGQQRIMGLKVDNDGLSISNSYLNDPSTDEILAVDNPSF